MPTYQLGAPVTLQVSLVDSDGVALVPVQLPRWRMLDQADAVLIDWADITPANGVATISLTAADTTLPAGQLNGFRLIELQVITVNGTLSLFTELLLRASSLAVPAQSFQRYGEAAIVAESIGRLDGWRTAGKIDRENALIEAATRIGRFNFGVGASQNRLSADESAVTWEARDHLELSELSEAEFQSLNARLLKALRLAQVYEADAILKPDTAASDLRDAGVISKKVGESSEQFTTRKRLELGVSSRAYEVLSPWMIRGVRIGRA